MDFFEKLNKKELNDFIKETENKIKSKKMKIKELEASIKLLHKDVINLGIDYEMLRLLQIKVENPHIGNEYLEPNDLQLFLQTILKTNDSYEKLNLKNDKWTDI